MFSKSEAGGGARRPGSLALRLAWWYAGSAFLLLLAGTGFLYWKLVQSSNAEDDQYLAEKTNTIRELLREKDFRTLGWEVEGESTARPAVEVMSRVSTEDGRVVVETTGMSGQLPARDFPADGRIEYRTVGNRIFRVLSEAAPGYRVQVAVEVTLEHNMFAQYREGLLTVLGTGLLLSAMIGFGLARKGIRPVEEIAATMRRIRSSTLNERVGTGGLPAELASLAATFNEMLDHLEEAFGRLARFSSDIAHELRTPINNIRGEVEVTLGKARPPEEYRDVLASALEECQRLSQMIDSLLFLARAENPQTEIRREVLDVGKELSAVREFYDAAAAEAGVRLDLTVAEPIAAPLDRTLFQRALGNLIENALAHTGRGGHIRLEAAREKGTLRVSVADDGCGIPAEHLARVFDRFHRVDPARSKNTGGAGLGLAIVKSVATLHGGDARIESAPGEGTRVSLHVPANPA
ncbi:MAG: heavy metal sensor histidine kinase [Acidobacteriota bacterium]|nr:heavy metal sensor histidine kinase [Acidobacteriota bacterium]